ncbi:hypothetical protein M378DRAFT_598388 [Amanita muscaria Koide BX008]|uniref:Uncharacterized protein n=1 Tax=Amanita muscaria (strain Koide BX008) TaxID=946122 RepID=A0A0C2TRZ2_AMAMK|nr:hypothetical protein M378DRAFT_598388 [Amanita muscaria Koide BX008]
MSYIDPLDDLPPPPAYSAEELDRKISTTIHLSLNTPQPQPDDDWEVWDEAAFEVAARALAVGGPSSAQAGSSTHPVEPLKIKKKGPEPYAPSKPRPNWLSQAESAPQDAQTSQCGAPNNTAPMPIAIHQIPEEEEEDEDHLSQPPPAFTPNAPSLDGPPYEQVMSPPWVADGSSVGSPLNSPTMPTQQLVYPEPPDDIPVQMPAPQADMRHRSPQPQVRMPQPQGDMHLRMPQGGMHHQIPRHSLPPRLPSAPQRTYQAVSEYSIPKPSHNSTFDPSVAYNQESNYGRSQAPMVLPQAPAADYSYNAAAFYKSVSTSLAVTDIDLDIFGQCRGCITFENKAITE